MQDEYCQSTNKKPKIDKETGVTLFRSPPGPDRNPVLDSRVTIWNHVEKRKLSGNSAPYRRNLQHYLGLHPDWELYTNQDALIPNSKLRRKPGNGKGLLEEQLAIASSGHGGKLVEDGGDRNRKRRTPAVTSSHRFDNPSPNPNPHWRIPDDSPTDLARTAKMKERIAERAKKLAEQMEVIRTVIVIVIPILIPTITPNSMLLRLMN